MPLTILYFCISVPCLPSSLSSTVHSHNRTQSSPRGNIITHWGVLYILQSLICIHMLILKSHSNMKQSYSQTKWCVSFPGQLQVTLTWSRVLSHNQQNIDQFYTVCFVNLKYMICVQYNYGITGIFIDRESKSLFYLIKCLYYVIIIIMINKLCKVFSF